LIQTFPLYQQPPPGIGRAVFMQFMVAECHRFDDGNGRLARIMMNAELVSAEQHKIIVPTVHRESYLNGLRQATGSGRFRTIAKVFTDLQAYTSTRPWEECGEVRGTLESHYAAGCPTKAWLFLTNKFQNLRLHCLRDEVFKLCNFLIHASCISRQNDGAIRGTTSIQPIPTQ